jgi:DivIVA domain-containing protein
VLTPEEITSREFLVSLRGYDRDEVHAFLDRVAEQMRELQQRVADFQGGAPAAPSVAEGSQPDTLFAQIGEETRRILEAAHEAGAQIKRSSRQEADRQMQSARQDAAKLVADGERRREAAERLVAELEAARDRLADDLRGVSRTVESSLRDLLGQEETSATVRDALAAETLPDDAAVAEPEPATDAVVAEPEPFVEAEPESFVEAEPEPATEAEPEPATEAEPFAEAEPFVESEREPESEPAVGEAELASAQPDFAVGEAEETLAEPAETAAAPEPNVEQSAESLFETTGPDDPFTLRQATLSPLHLRLVRQIKRGLQDLQNVVLDQLRRADGKGAVEEFMPSDEEFTAFSADAAGVLEEAYRSGLATAGTLADRELPGPSESRQLGDDFRDDAAERIRGGLAATLQMGLEVGEELPALSGRVSAVFSDLKQAASEEWAATHLVRCYELGLLDAWAAGDIAQRRWVLGAEPRCPEARCRHNGQAGALPLGEAFPSGHVAPPVHPGCTCTTLPALEPAESAEPTVDA